MTDEQALLAAILAAPADDLPRLVYADFVEEHGDPDRAEFIRVQIRLARWVCCYSNLDTCFDRCSGPDDVERTGCDLCREAVPLARREKWLYDAGAAELWDHADVPVQPERLLFRRGFVAELTMPAADWLAHGDAVLAAHPVERVRLTTVPDYLLETSAVHARAMLAGSDFWIRLDSRREGASVPDYLLRLRWPGVAFELPPDPPALSFHESRVAYHRSRIAAQLGLDAT